MSDTPSSRRMAPVQMPDGGHRPHGIRCRIPWRIHMKAAEFYNKHWKQSAEQLADRGGFRIEELIYFLAGEIPGEHDDGPMFSDFFNNWPEEVEPLTKQRRR